MAVGMGLVGKEQQEAGGLLGMEVPLDVTAVLCCQKPDPETVSVPVASSRGHPIAK